MNQYKKLTQDQVSEVLDYLDKEELTKSDEIADEMGVRKMQVAGVKKWRTMGKY